MRVDGLIWKRAKTSRREEGIEGGIRAASTREYLKDLNATFDSDNNTHT
jgi:hypothetical protein